MSAFSTSYVGIVRALVSEIGIVTGAFQDFDFLLGMDVISLGDLTITNKGATSFAFRIPSEGIPA